MATKKDIAGWIEAALERFYAVYPFSRDAETEIVIASRAKAQELHYSTIQRTGAKPSEYISTTDAETFVGPNGCAIIIYSWRIKDQKHFNRVFWHEMGHRSDYIFNARFREYVYKHFNSDDDICGGYSIWSEFIAEKMYYTVADETPEKDYHSKLYTLNELLRLAVNDDSVFPYYLAHYAAMVMDDPTIDALYNSFQFDFGLSQLSDEVASKVEVILKLLNKQLCKAEYWIATEEFLIELGQGFNDLWNAREAELQMERLKKLLNI